MRTKFIMLILASTLLVACGTSSADQVQTNEPNSTTTAVVVTASSEPARLTLADVAPPMQVCVHSVESDYNADIVESYNRDGMNFIGIVEYLPDGVTEETSSLAAGYSLEPMPELEASSWMSQGYC